MLAAFQVINKILQTKDYHFIKNNNLDETYFGGYENEFNFIMEHYKKNGNIPDTLTFLSNFPNFNPTEVNETDNYLLDRLQEERGFIKFTQFMPELNRLIKEDSRMAYNYIIQEMSNLKPHTVCKGKDIISGFGDRYQVFIDKQTKGKDSVISSGLPELDSIIRGWEFGEELVTIVGRTGQGKSWMLLKFLMEAWKQGYKVGLYSGEMSSTLIGYRFDTLYKHLSNLFLNRGNYIENYKEYGEQFHGLPNAFMVITQKEFGGRPTVQQIRNFVEENNIQILGIDQFSLMEDGRSSARDPERIKLAHIAEDLFLLSTEYKIPVIGLAQANRDGIKKNSSDTPTLENIKESDDISHNSSKVLGIRQSNGNLIIDVLKNRNGKCRAKLQYDWNIDKGEFYYIPTADDMVANEIKDNAMKSVQARHENIRANNPF